MKIFQTIQTQYSILGVCPPNQSTQKFSVIWRYLVGFSLFVYLILSQFLYMVHVASGFMEYVQLICAISGTLLLFFGLAAIGFRKSTLFEIIDRIEKLIATSETTINHLFFEFNFILRIKRNLCVFLGFKYPKSKAFFLKTNRQVERLSEIIFMLIMKIGLPGFMLPKCIVSLTVYIRTDTGRDAFELPIPMW